MADAPAAAIGGHARWTQTAITALRQRLTSGETVTEIAAALDRPIDDVTTMMSRLRLRV